MASSHSLSCNSEAKESVTDVDHATKKVKHRDCSNPFIQADVSFKDKVLGSSDMDLDMNKELLDEADFDDLEISVDSLGSFPIISFFDGVENLLVKRWCKALILHLLGRKIGFKALHSRLQELWSASCFSLLDLGNDYFLVNFSDNEGYLRALFEGPWVILGNYL